MADFDEEDEEFEEQDEGEEDQENLSEEEQEKKQMEESLFKAKLKKLHADVKIKKLATLHPQQKKILQDAKKHESLKAQTGAIYAMLTINKFKRSARSGKLLFGVSSALPVIGIGALCIFLLVAVIAFFETLFSFLDFGENGATGDSMFGITGKEFYGMRMVYRDDDLAQKKIVEDYVFLVEKGKNEVQKISSVTLGEETYSLVLNVGLTIPSEEYDFSSFDEASFKTEFPTTYNLVFEIAKAVNKADNGSTFSGTSLIECVDGIKYFGYSSISEISENLINEVVSSSQISATDSNGATVVDSVTLSNIKNALTDKARENLAQEFALEKWTVRTEKLFIKDFILEDEEATVSGVTMQNYEAVIFMPKQAVEFKSFSFAVGGTTFENFEISVAYENNTYPITTDGENLGDETNKGYLYNSKDVSISAGIYDAIDTNNLKALETTQSLFDLVQNTNYSTYLTTETIDGAQVQTFKKSGVVVNLGNSTPFIITEFEVLYE